MSEAFAGWAIVELMGHRVRGGEVREVEMYGGKFLRVDVAQPEHGEPVTEYYSASSIFSVRPASEEIVRNRVTTDLRPPRPTEYRLTGPDDEP